MNSCRLEDWLDAIRLTFEALHRDGSPIAVVGFCLGGTLGLATARELNPRAVVCLSAPVLPLQESLFSAESMDGKELLRTDLLALDCLSPRAVHWRRHSIHRLVTPRFLRNYQEAIGQAYRDLPDLRCPLAVAQADQARTVPPDNAVQILERAGHSAPRYLQVSGAGHALPIDCGRRSVAAWIGDFLNTIESQESRTF